MHVKQSLVAEKIRRLVAAPSREAARAVLDRHGADMAEPMRSRFQLAALKLYEEGGRGGVDKLAEIAQMEPRDVLAWAENPETMRAPATTTGERRDRLRARDRRQYRAWLNKA